VVLGFQGLVFVDLAMRAPAATPGTLGADVAVHFSDASRDFVFSSAYLVFEPVAEGGSLCSFFRVLFREEPNELDGEGVALNVTLTGARASAQSTAFFSLIYRGCTEDPSGNLICQTQ
jgi:hypothetical protein